MNKGLVHLVGGGSDGFTSYKYVRNTIADRFRQRGEQDGVRLVSLIFGHDSSKIVKEEMKDRLLYWSKKSGQHFDLFPGR